MKLNISIHNVQHIKHIDFSVDMDSNSLICIAGKNGVGKTTLLKSIKNLIYADTFQKTSSSRIFTDESEIAYTIGDDRVVFRYDAKRKIIDTRDKIPSKLRKDLFVELPIPHGERFNFFKKISEVDPQLRSKLVGGQYGTPTELVDFLNVTYGTKKFDKLVEIMVGKVPYYAIFFDDGYYLREDYFSSGEYFLISLYRRVISGFSTILIDEVDISLDAAAQVRLVEFLRLFKDKYSTTFIFTTHSLAMMRTLKSNELYYMEECDGAVAINNRSYAFVKSTLFGFKGWDKYILTEDKVLRDFLEYFISMHCKPSFYQHKIIHVGGGTNTADLMKRNESENFFSKDPRSVIVVLDGDQKNLAHSKKKNVYCIPMESVEKELLARCLRGEFWDFHKLTELIEDYQRLIDFLDKKNNSKKNRFKIYFYKIVLFFKKSTATRRSLSVAQGEPAKEKDFNGAGKRLFEYLIKSKELTRQDIFEFLIRKNPDEINKLRKVLEAFICLDVE